VEPQINEATVSILLGEVRDLLSAEQQREQSLITRASGLTGFVGLIVALIGVVGGGTGASLSERTKLALGVLVIAGLVFLAIAVFVVIVFVLLPSPSKSIATNEVEKYPSLEYVSGEAVFAEGRIMRGLIEQLRIERRRNKTKADGLKAGYVLVGFGIAFIAALGLILGAESFL
jgi:hypothetical protein